MHDGEAFFVSLQVTNALQYTYTIRSDGVTLKLEPLLPGEVRDGPVLGVDLHFQVSTDTLSANWDGFGLDKSPDTLSEHNHGIQSLLNKVLKL